MKREPVITTAGVVSAIAALIGLWVAFGGNLTDAQREAVMQVAVILAPVIAAGLTALIGRLFVTPLADPRDDEGVRLQRVDGSEPVKR